MPRQNRDGTSRAGRRGALPGVAGDRERRDSPGPRAPRDRTRGQTNLDFALGVGLFVTVLIFIFAFAPGILAPFTGGMQEETVASDRIADQLARDMLGSPAQPLVLKRACTVAFFAGDPPVKPASGPVAGTDRDCGYLPDRGAISGYPIRERIGVMKRTIVNVVIKADLNGDDDQNAVCWDAGAGALQEKGGGTCGEADDTVFDAGSLQPANNDVITATRTVTLDDQRLTMYVHVA